MKLDYSISQQFCESDCYYQHEYVVTIRDKSDGSVVSEKTFTDYDMAVQFTQINHRR